VIALEYYTALISAVSGSKTLSEAQPERSREAQLVAGADKSRQLGKIFGREISVQRRQTGERQPRPLPGQAFQ